MIGTMKFYELSELPSGNFDGSKILECVGDGNLMLAYDFARSVSLLGIDGEDADQKISEMVMKVAGMGFTSDGSFFLDSKVDCMAYSVYRNVEKFSANWGVERLGARFFYDVFDVVPRKGFLAILFVHADIAEVNSVKARLEGILSSKNVRETESSLRAYLSSRISSTTHRDLYYESEEKIMLNSVIESLNKAVLSNGLAYKVFLVVPKDSEHLRKYIETHFLVLAKYNLGKADNDLIIKELFKKPALPFGTDYAKEFLNFYGFHSINHALVTSPPSREEGITIGTFVKDGVSETDLEIKVEPSAMNLGFIITGLPGSGKTREAMSIIDSLLSKGDGKRPPVFVITPTNEWEGFASSHDMFFIKLYRDDTPINFFRRPATIETEKFYGNLAMILSSAANAGPYRNPMEKCMLNAFRRCYNGNDKPDPIEVYNEIEESIVRYHGKRIGNGVKYTKHGENIKSALENLRGILSRGQYCVENGVRIEDFFEKGAVFDVSGASSNTRAQLYALILNQIYAITTNFDTNGDSELRLLICLEEAQTIFGDEDSPAVEDIKQRIQDFRKQGIGLVLLTHNINDIDIGIRRLCQLKLYLKQAPDIALIASKDLIFANVEQDNVMLKLKTLSSRTGAFSYVSKTGIEKKQQDTVFIKTRNYESKINENFNNPINYYTERLNLFKTKLLKCKMKLGHGGYGNIEVGSLQDSYSIRFNFLGEEILTVALNKLDSTELPLFEGKGYKVQVLNSRGRVLKELYMNATRDMMLDIDTLRT